MKKKLLFLLCAMMAHTGVFADLQQDSAGNYLIGNANDLLEFSLFVRSGHRHDWRKRLNPHWLLFR